MNIGKMLAFGKLTGIMNDKITKELIMRKFRLICEGKKAIDFDKFYELINIFATIDQALIPRLGVDEKEAFKEKLKMISKPFYTQDSNGREIKKSNIFIPVLTAHSGKTSDALIDEVKQRKRNKFKSVLPEENKSPKKKSISVSRYENSRFVQRDQSHLISPKQLSMSNIKNFDENLKIMEKIMTDQGDEEWMK